MLDIPRTNPTTGLCLITLEHGHFRWRCRNTKSQKARRLADLRGLIPEGTTISAVGIDGPLTTDFQLINRYRAADAFLSRGAFQKRCKPGPVDVPRGQLLHYHATELAKLVLELNEEGYLHVEDAGHPDRIHQSRVVEAFPNAFLGVLLEGARCDQICDQLKGTGQEKKSDEFWRVAVEDDLLLRNLIKHLVPQICPGQITCYYQQPRPPCCVRMCARGSVRSQEQVRFSRGPGGRQHLPATLQNVGSRARRPLGRGCVAKKLAFTQGK